MSVSASAGPPALDAAAPAGGFAAPSEEFWACHRLATALLPPHRLRALLRFAGSPVAALGLPEDALRGPDVALTQKQAARLADVAQAPIPAADRERAEKLAVSVVTFAHADAYPANLLPLSDAPPLLFVRGAAGLQADDRFCVAIVGSRRTTAYGRGQAERFARAFAARGLAVVSGGAAGIDTAAHRGAIAAGGRTIAVLGCGVDVVYPAENRALFQEMAERAGGAVVSEFPLGTQPEPWRFPTRNRIIAGMARAVVVIETPPDSGALITARNAAEYGRDVWVVPGPVDSGRSRGGHQLIQDGAALADSPDDVLAGLGIPADPQSATLAAAAAAAAGMDAAAAAPPPVPGGLSADEAALLGQLDLTPRLLDDAGGAVSLQAARATAAATLLEMKGLVRRQPGNLYVRVL